MQFHNFSTKVNLGASLRTSYITEVNLWIIEASQAHRWVKQHGLVMCNGIGREENGVRECEGVEEIKTKRVSG